MTSGMIDWATREIGVFSHRTYHSMKAATHAAFFFLATRINRLIELLLSGSLVCVEQGRLCREMVFVKRMLSGFGLDLRLVLDPTEIVWARRFPLDRITAIIIHF